jgi:hypothetical protein
MTDSELYPNCFGLGVGNSDAGFDCDLCQVRDECQKGEKKMKFEIEFEARSGIILLVGLLVAYFALNTNAYAWSTFLFQTATVVGAGIIMLVMNERAKGNMLDMPTFDWKAVVKIILRIAIGFVLIGIGISFAMLGIIALVPMVPAEIMTLIFIAAIVVGIIAVGFGLKILSGFLEGEKSE